MTPEIAIVDSNTLSCLGLQNLLEEIIPTAVIRSFRSFGELMDDTPDMYVHYFISSQIYFEHTAFFLERKPKTIVLVNGETVPQLSSVPTLNIYQDEQNLAKNILQLRGVRPFLSDKFDITKHKRYKELSDFDKKNAFDVERYLKHELRLRMDEEFDCYEVDVSEESTA